MPKRKIGRPCELFRPGVQKRILDALRWGSYRQDAAAYGGVDRVTFDRWMRLGEEKKNGAFHSFRTSVEKAEADAKAEALRDIRKAGKDPRRWTARAWLLERRYPDQFGRRMTIEGEGVSAEETRLTGEDAEALTEGVKRVLTAVRVRAIEGGPAKP